MGSRSASASLAVWLVLAPVFAAAQNPTAQIVLRWKEVEGAASYELEIATDADFKNSVVRERSATAGFRWKEIPRVPHYWRVRSVDENGRQSPWSESLIIDAAVAAPTLLSPSPGARLLMAEPRPVELAFQVSQVIKAYRIEIATSPRFTERLLDRSVTNSPVPFTARAPGTYYWRIFATDLKGRSTGAGEIRSFQVVLAPPRLITPVDGLTLSWAEHQTPLDLKWAPGWGAVRYLVEVQPQGASTVKSSVKRPTVSFPLTAAGSYEWRVRAEDAAGGLSDWSARATFTLLPAEVVPPVAPPAPLAAPALLAPTSGAVLSRAKVGPELSWAAVPRADRYEVELGAKTQSTSGTTLTWAALDVGEYTWRVRALAGDRESGAWSEGKVFTVELPASVRAEFESSEPSLVADGKSSTELRVRLFDVAGAPVRGAPVHIEVNAGVVEVVVESAEGYSARYVSPAGAPPGGSARVLVRDRDFEQAGSVNLVNVVSVERFALGARAGFNGNFAGPSSPHGGLEVRYRTPLFSDRLGVSLRGGFHVAAAQATVLAETVALEAQIVSTTLLAFFEVLRLDRFRFLAAVGPILYVARVSAGVERTTHVVPGVQGLLGGGVRLGPVELVAEVGYSFGRIEDAGAVLGTGGLLVSAGVLWWL